MKEGKSYTVTEIRDKLANFCVYQDRCHWEVENKMNEYFLIPEAKDEILIYLLQHNFLSEERFARSYARGKFSQKSWGRIKIIQGLKQRKVPKNIIDLGLQELDNEQYTKTLIHLIQKKISTINEKNVYTKRQKIIRYLLQKGYEMNLILPLLDEELPV